MRSSLPRQAARWARELKPWSRQLIAAALYTSWLAAFCLSSLPFPEEQRPLGNAFDIAEALGFLAAGATLCAIRPSKKTNGLDEESVEKPFLAATGAALCATAERITMDIGPLATAVESSAEAALAATAAIAFTTGVGTFFFLLAALGAFAPIGRRLMPLACGIVFALGVLATAAAQWLIVADHQAFFWALAIAASYALWHKGADGKLARIRTHVDAARIENRMPKEPSAPKSPTALFALNAFFAGLAIGNFPGNFHLTHMENMLPPSGLFHGVTVGLMSADVLIALALAAVVMLAVGVGIACTPSQISLISVVAVALLVGACVTVPMYNTSPITVLIPIAAAMFPISAQVALDSRECEDSPSASIQRREARMLSIGGAAFLGAALLSAAHVLNHVEGDDPRQIAMFALMIGIVAADAIVLVQIRRTLAALYLPHAGAKPAAPVDESSLAGRCETIASRCGLTKRETEVFRLLAEGRDGPYIQNELGIARNTFKTHAAHVYQKVGVSSKQELLDVVRKGDDT